ncbi:MAG: ATP-binding protein [Elusimicrobia bacterium]|nr:ATP-binding protein [Elusimicrobiota bacterium]
MKRDFSQTLLEWKASQQRKPLLLQGARQTGKTFLLKQFGRTVYERLFYFNFEEEPGLKDIFQRDLRPERLLPLLSAARKGDIRPGRDLIFFDEIQSCNEALNSLKYFCEEAPECHVAGAGSLLGLLLSKPASFPVGKVNIFHLYPMSFFEFLDAVDESRLRKLLEGVETHAPLPFHDELVDWLKLYYFTGGMPEAVSLFSTTRRLNDVRSVHRDILKAYALDFAKHAPPADVPKISMIWESVPSHLSRENKKFIFNAIHPSARSREYEGALQWLENAGLIHRSWAVTRPEMPLRGAADRKSFKVFLLDVGLLGAMTGLDEKTVIEGTEMFHTYKGAFVENFAAQQLTAMGCEQLYYWRSEGLKAEVDFLIERGGAVWPLEVKAGINPKSQSLSSYGRQFHPSLLLRSTLLNLKQDGNILNTPLYAINALPRFLSPRQPLGPSKSREDPASS